MTESAASRLQEALIRVEGHSPYLRQLMNRHRDVADLLQAGDLDAALDSCAISSEEPVGVAMRRAKGRLALALGVGDLAGMDPLEVGEKTFKGMADNRGLILTHPDHREDIDEIYRTTLAALPDEPIPEGRAHIEALRRDANRAATAGMRIGLADLT